MADNVSVPFTGQVATDDVGGKQYQRIKLTSGTPDSEDHLVVSNGRLGIINDVATTAGDINVASSAASQQLLPANAGRKGLLLTNTDANTAYIYYGTTATPTKFTWPILTGASWAMSAMQVYTGRIDVIWAADGSGALIGSELGGSGVVTVPTAPPVVVPNSRPFAATSPFNTPIPAGTQWYDHIRLHTMPAGLGGGQQHWYLNFALTPVYAAGSDPLWTVTLPDYIALEWNRNRPATTFTGIRAPSGLVTGAGTDNVLILIQPDGSYIEIWQAVINNGAHTITGANPSGWATGNILTGSGVGGLVAQGGNNAGVRASNFSWAAGLITPEDLASGVIDHALVMALPQQMLKDTYAAYRPPATAWDNNSGSYGPFDAGTRIGVPAGVAAPAGLTSYGTMIFNALQKYGAFVGDYTGGNLAAIYVDNRVPNDATIWPVYAYWDWGGMADLDDIGTTLRIVGYQP